MVQFTTMNNTTINIINTISSTIEPLTTGNYSNHTNHTNHSNGNNKNYLTIYILFAILSIIALVLLEFFHNFITVDNELFIVKIIKFPFKLPNIIIMIIIYPFGEETKNNYKTWRKNLKEYWHDTCLDFIDYIFNTERVESLPYVIQDISNDEVNQFFSDEYETIKYTKEEIEICSICMDKLDVKCNDVKNEKSVLLTCGHCFHEGCLKDWYKSSEQKDCPICREKLEIKNYYVFDEINL